MLTRYEHSDWDGYWSDMEQYVGEGCANYSWVAARFVDEGTDDAVDDCDTRNCIREQLLAECLGFTEPV